MNTHGTSLELKKALIRAILADFRKFQKFLITFNCYQAIGSELVFNSQNQVHYR